MKSKSLQIPSHFSSFDTISKIREIVFYYVSSILKDQTSNSSKYYTSLPKTIRSTLEVPLIPLSITCPFEIMRLTIFVSCYSPKSIHQVTYTHHYFEIMCNAQGSHDTHMTTCKSPHLKHI